MPNTISLSARSYLAVEKMTISPGIMTVKPLLRPNPMLPLGARITRVTRALLQVHGVNRLPTLPLSSSNGVAMQPQLLRLPLGAHGALAEVLGATL